MATPLPPDVVPDFSHCEFYSSVEARAIHQCGEWMAQAGFVNGLPVKIRVMKLSLRYP
ncbi:SymE family type I addiction module toxin [Klebsiella michiganensis]|uniref:SymE family type I addiction module toxin n=1 Tax=Klebsiella michiganensis TaxID=1134687 RepID=UPI003D00F55F